MKEHYGYVYKILFDKPVEHIVYIGSTKLLPARRFCLHKGPQTRPTKLNQMITKYGAEHFRLEIIEYADSNEQLRLREQYWTLQLGDAVDNCNECIASRHSAEQRASASQNNYRNRRVVCDNDNKEYRSCTDASHAYGVSYSSVSECCAMHKIDVKGFRFRYADIDINIYKAYWESPEEERSKFFNYLKDIQFRSQKRVRCVETGQVFENTVRAAEAFGIHRTTVAFCCERHTALRKSGYHLEYIG